MTLQEQIDSGKLSDRWTVSKVRSLGVPETDAGILSGSICRWQSQQTEVWRGRILDYNEKIWGRYQHIDAIKELHGALRANSCAVETADNNKEEKPKKSRQSKKANVSLNIDDISEDTATQPRVEQDDSVIKEYAEQMKGGTIFPPVTVFHYDNTYLLADGYHRLAAAKEAGFDTIDAEIREGTKRDAILFAIDANAKHGLNWTNNDKQRAAKILLEDEEWGKWSSRVVAKRCGVSHTFIDRLKRKLSGNGCQTETKVTRGGTEYTMQTASIGKGNSGQKDSDASQSTKPVADNDIDQVLLDDIQDDVTQSTPEPALNVDEEVFIPAPEAGFNMDLPALTGEEVLLVFLRVSRKGSVAEMFRRAEEELEKMCPGFLRNVLMGIPRVSRMELCRELGICGGADREPTEALDKVSAQDAEKGLVPVEALMPSE